MNARTIGVLMGAAALGLAGGYVVVEGWLTWQLALAALALACAAGIYAIRERVGRTMVASGQVMAASGRAVAVSGRSMASTAARRLRNRG